jgi:hypothetical protein
MVSSSLDMNYSFSLWMIYKLFCLDNCLVNFYLNILLVLSLVSGNLYFAVQEVKNKGPVSKIDLWDEAHKKKDGQYTNKNVQQLMVCTRTNCVSHMVHLSPLVYLTLSGLPFYFEA